MEQETWSFDHGTERIDYLEKFRVSL